MSARGGHEPALHLGDTEASGVGRDDEVAREHDLEATRERGPVDRGDEWLREVAGDESGETAGRAGDLRAATRGNHLEVGPGREDRSRARDHDGANVGVGRRGVEEPAHGHADLGIDRVARLRSVEPQDLDLSPSLLLDDRHRCSLFAGFNLQSGAT